MKYAITTKGMGCPHCIKRVTKAMTELGAEIGKVELNDIAVTTDRSEAELREAIEKLGFEVLSVKAE